MKRILILMSDTGGGHRAAAEAIRDALRLQHGDEAHVDIVDVFRYYSPAPLKYAPEFYPWWVNRSKTSWGLGYNLSNTRQRAKILSNGMYVTIEGGLKRMFREYPADVVVCVHSLLTRPSMQALLRLDERPPFITVVTDLVSTHMFWYDRRAERCLVPTQPAYDRGLETGMSPEQMRITGLPVHPRFTQSLTDRTTARHTLGWDPDLPAILLVGGGDGMGPLYKTARAINNKRLNGQLAIIAGRNAELKDRLQSSKWNQPTHIYGFVSDMPRLMAAAEVLVTKAGPATITEACIAGLPMILYDAIPGQETGNVDYVVDNGAGVFAPTPLLVADAAASWLAEGPDGLKQRARSAHLLARPNAVWDIVDEVWSWAHQPRIPTEHRSLLDDLAYRTRNLKVSMPGDLFRLS